MNMSDGVPHRVRGAGLPQEYALALFIKDIPNPQKSWSTHTPACEWDRVMCDEKNNVERLEWYGIGLSGEFQWSCLPNSLLHLNLSSDYSSDGTFKYLKGEISHVDFASLPRGLLELFLYDLGICGSLEVSDLPPSLRVLDLYGNNIQGSVDFTALPETMIEIFLRGNPIQGVPDFSKLPHGLQRLTLTDTKLTFPSGKLPSCVEISDPCEKAPLFL